MIKKYLKLYICLLLGAIACSIGIGSAKIDELTQKHANEFRIVYERHRSALILALNVVVAHSEQESYKKSYSDKFFWRFGVKGNDRNASQSM